MALQMLECLFLEHNLANEKKGLFFNLVQLKLRPSDDEIACIIRCLDDSYQLCQISALRLLSSPFFEVDKLDFSQYLVETKQQMLTQRSVFTLTSAFRLRFYLLKNPTELKSIFSYFLKSCDNRLALISENYLALASDEGFVYSILNAINVVLEVLDLECAR
ncbi:unnamed protein product [Gongylonema pulchrum]|uniref:Uncharacterized protein n=1 Tax=Gongylonema pulchrum TaxID=637853 RepID=A0A183EXK6_9BILA|nr:unnamed protein product [Gongylonema pulchrum]